MNNEEKTANSQSYLTFKLGREIFAVHVSKVSNILEMSPITHVPKSPPHMKGVTNLRGSVLPVADSRIKLDMDETEYTANTCILVLNLRIEDEKVDLGAIVDSVQEVVEIEENQLLDPPSIGNKYKTEYIRKIIQISEKFIMLLDVDKIFATDDVIKLQEKE